MLVWIWIMHEKKAEVEMVMLEQIGVSISEERFFFTLYFKLYSGAVCVTEHLQHSVIAGNSKDPSASFNARHLCCPWAINNSWRSVLLEYYKMHVCTRLHLWAYTFAWMCESVFSNVCFSNAVCLWKPLTAIIYTHIFLKWLWTDSVLQHYMFLELFRQ